MQVNVGLHPSFFSHKNRLSCPCDLLTYGEYAPGPHVHDSRFLRSKKSRRPAIFGWYVFRFVTVYIMRIFSVGV